MVSSKLICFMNSPIIPSHNFMKYFRECKDLKDNLVQKYNSIPTTCYCTSQQYECYRIRPLTSPPFLTGLNYAFGSSQQKVSTSCLSASYVSLLSQCLA